MRVFAVLTVSFVLLAGAAPASAGIIAYTGIPTDDGFWGLSGYDGHFGFHQWFAGQFEVTSPTIITGLEGYISNQNFSAGIEATYTVALYSDGGEVPGLEIFAGEATIAPGFEGFSGLTSLNIPVLSGLYWIALEVQPGQTLDGWVRRTAPHPFANEAYNNGTTGGVYLPFDHFSVGYRVTGVPEPATLLLLGMGAAGVVVNARRRRKQVSGAR